MWTGAPVGSQHLAALRIWARSRGFILKETEGGSGCPASRTSTRWLGQLGQGRPGTEYPWVGPGPKLNRPWILIQNLICKYGDSSKPTRPKSRAKMRPRSLQSTIFRFDCVQTYLSPVLPENSDLYKSCPLLCPTLLHVTAEACCL